MSRLVARILLSMLMFPLAVVVYALTFFVSESVARQASISFARREQFMFLSSGVVTWIGVAAYWILLWKSSVRWTHRRIGQTIGAAVAAAVVCTIVAAFIGSMVMRGPAATEFALWLGGVLAILLWLMATILVWRETPPERAARIGGTGAATVACPVCGYNLTGLSEARCPECGSRFTLNELMAGQSARTGGELD